jgi:tol-pal system protein YbgF
MLVEKQKGPFCYPERSREIAGGIRSMKYFRSSSHKRRCLFAAYLLLFCVSCLLSACATNSDIEMLRMDMNKIQRDSNAMSTEINKLKEQTAASAKEESFHALRQSQAEMQNTISNMSKDIQVLSGKFDENKYFVEKTLKDSTSEVDLMKSQITGMENRIKELKERLNILEGQRSQGTGKDQMTENEEKDEEPQKNLPPANVQSEKSSAPADKVSKYEAAYSSFKNKKYKDAREKFEAFIKEFPKDELTDNAYFWIGETYYNEKDFEGAILAHETFLKKYPNSEKAPSALLKQGLSFIEIGDKKTGKVILEQLIERYPKSKEAETAKKDLENLDKKPVKKKK